MIEYIKISKYCPICGKPTEIKDNDGVKTLWCINPSCEGKLINIIDHFVGKKGLDVKGLSKATIEKLINKGWLNCRADVFKLSDKQKEWEKLPGFGIKSVSNIINAIDGAKNTNFEAYLSSLGIPLIGRMVSKELAKRFESYNDFRKAIKEGYDFSQLEGFGYEMNKALTNYDYTEADEIAEMLNFKQPEIQTQGTSAEGIVFCITGKTHIWKNRDELKSHIESIGGKVVGSMSSKVNYLINNDNTSTSAKNVAAQKAGIPIITEEEFQNLFDF